jgi:8-amino-7-oxononanoate synthase
VHASIHDGMRRSLANTRISFKHNDMDSFRENLQSIKNSQPSISSGQRCVLIFVESVHSMDGDVCPLKELLAVGREVLPLGNIEFFIDESHATGVIGPQGAGLVNEFDLQKDFAIRLHPCGKALASVGAVLLCNATVRTAMFNFARSIIYTTAPPFTDVAAIRSAYNLMRTGRTKEVQDRVQHLVKLFCHTITSDPIWTKANEMCILQVAVSEGWKDKQFSALSP